MEDRLNLVGEGRHVPGLHNLVAFEPAIVAAAMLGFLHLPMGSQPLVIINCALLAIANSL